MSEHLLPSPVNWERVGRDESFPRLAAQIRNTTLGKSHEIGLLGLPFDGAIPTRPGARFAPETIRRSLLRLAADDGERALTQVDIGDYGDVACLSGNVAATHDRCYELARAVASSAAFPVFLGGDHSLTFPCFRALAERARPLGLITFDAHHDVRTYSAEQITSGTPFRRCLELGVDSIRGANVVQLGLRPFSNSRAYADYCRGQGMTCLSVRDMEARGIVEAARAAVEIAAAGTAGIYLSVDIDVVDAAFAPGASATAPGGLTAREILAGVATVARQANLVAMDVMEVSPPLDEGTRTSDLAALIVATVLAGRAARAR